MVEAVQVSIPLTRGIRFPDSENKDWLRLLIKIASHI